MKHQSFGRRSFILAERTIYSDISRRTGGKIYLGVVGGVRTGKSTFIKRFMDTLVIPHIEDDDLRRRAIDELPQSGAGRTIMTTEPKFIPEEAVEVKLGNTSKLSLRLIDCVGYIVPSALGYIEDEQPRMVKTPWYDEEIPFNMAAEIGTQKVIADHSSVGIVVTTDGSVTDIPREEYAEAEQRVIEELKALGKPFVVLLNCAEPHSDSAKALSGELCEKYGVSVIPINCLEMGESEIARIMAGILFEFPVREISVDMPRWVTSLERDHAIKSSIMTALTDSASSAVKLADIGTICKGLSNCEYIRRAETGEVDLGTGTARIDITLEKGLFCSVIGEKTGMDICDESDILKTIVELSSVREKFDKLAQAYSDALETGYGIVMPSTEELTLEEPQIVKQGSRYGIKLRAAAPSIHMLKTNVTTEVTPIVGSEEQSQELVSYLLGEFKDDPVKIWQSNIFGKSLNELVGEGMHNKLYRMPSDARLKLGETVERIINDGCNGLICIIL